MQQEIPPRDESKRLLCTEVLLDMEFPSVCEGKLGHVGNGGLILRSMKWIIHAIKVRPHAKLSGIDISATPLVCKVFDDINEDFCSGTILLGLGDPLPTAYETCSSPRRTFFLHALSFECTSKLCGTFLNQFSYYFHTKKKHNTIYSLNCVVR